MADTINLPGMGQVKTVYVVGGVALVVGIVGYAYYSRSQTPSDYVGASEDDYGASDYESPLGSSGGNSTVDVDQTEGLITTNGAWTVKAVEHLTAAGFEPGLAIVALGKYLARKSLTSTEIDAVLAARGAVGDPPVGGPYPINEGLPSTPSSGQPKAPTNLWQVKSGRTWIDLTWDGVPGATGYVVYRNGATYAQSTTNKYTMTRLSPNGSYQVQVAAVNSAGEGPKSNTITAKTTK